MVERVKRLVNKCRRRPLEDTHIHSRVELDEARHAVVAESQRVYFSNLRRDLKQMHPLKSKS